MTSAGQQIKNTGFTEKVIRRTRQNSFPVFDRLSQEQLHFLRHPLPSQGSRIIRIGTSGFGAIRDFWCIQQEGSVENTPHFFNKARCRTRLYFLSDTPANSSLQSMSIC